MSVVFLQRPTDGCAGGGWSGLVAEALERMEATTERTLCLEPGEFRIRASACSERFCAVSNHDSDVRRVAFDFSGRSNFVFDGQGADLRFVGRVIPFFLEGCRNVVLRNFTVDWERPFFTEGIVCDVRGRSQVVLEIDEGRYPVAMRGGMFRFVGDDYESGVFDNSIEVDAQTGAVAASSWDCWGIRENHRMTPAGPSRYLLEAPFLSEAVEGNRIVLPHELRTSPALVLSRSDTVLIEDCELRQAGGMGVIAQMCRDVTLRRMRVAPSPDRGCFTSLNGDATHFVECTGRIELLDCAFSGQLDDGSNVHGVYLKIVSVRGGHELLAAVGQAQQSSVDYFRAGDVVGLVNPENFLPEAVMTISSVRRVDAGHQVFTMCEPLPDFAAGRVLGSLGRAVDFCAGGCRFERSRTDGLLLSAPGRLEVRDNEFSIPGRGITVTCDASEWYESGPVGELTVSRNVFRDCSYGTRPDPAAICAAPNDSHSSARDSVVHRQIVIRDNAFHGRRPFVSLYRSEARIEGNHFAGAGGIHDPEGAIVHPGKGQTG